LIDGYSRLDLAPWIALHRQRIRHHGRSEFAAGSISSSGRAIPGNRPRAPLMGRSLACSHLQRVLDALPLQRGLVAEMRQFVDFAHVMHRAMLAAVLHDRVGMRRADAGYLAKLGRVRPARN
jgi:hypothetical protein